MPSNGVFPFKIGIAGNRLLMKMAGGDLSTTIETHNLIKYGS